MEMKEALCRVWEKINDESVLKQYDACAEHFKDFSGKDIYRIYLQVPKPTKHNPDAVKCMVLMFICSDSCHGFSTHSTRFGVDYECTKDEAIEIKYIYHQIEKKLEKIERDELLELL